MTIYEQYSLRDYNTFGLNVKAQFFCKVENKEDLLELTEFSKKTKKDIFIIGKGSNILFTKDQDKLIATLNFGKVKIVNQSQDYVDITAEAGTIWDDLVLWAINHGFYGIENLSFIPGTAGAAPVQNIGAYGVEIKDVLLWVEIFDPKLNEFYRIPAEKCGFNYRTSVFKTKLQNVIITTIALRLKTKPDFNLNYKDLKPYKNSYSLTAQKLREIIKQIRSRKLPDPSIIGNAGSFFKNPVISKQQAAGLKKRFPQMPMYELSNGVKIPAGWLIEYLGYKGYRTGDAGVYKNNALVLVNYGNATGQQLLNLARKIQADVDKTFGIKLEPEVKII